MSENYTPIMIGIGFGNSVRLQGIDAIVNPESAPIKRLIQEAKEANRLIDATQGRKTRSVVIMTSGAVVLSALQAETITSRVNSD